jgi:hypothetical protein
LDASICRAVGRDSLAETRARPQTVSNETDRRALRAGSQPSVEFTTFR